MHTAKTLFTALVIAVSVLDYSTAGELAGGVNWNDPVATVRTVLEQRCSSTRAIAVEPPSFPLAAKEECHYVCADLKTETGIVGQSVFVFADNKLVMIEARDGAIEAFSAGSDEPSHYMHYEIYDHGERWADTSNDTVWFLSEEARHPNLFTFSNPFLAPNPITPRYEQSAAIPPVLDFGVSLEQAQSKFKSDCPILLIEENKVWLPNEPAMQIQVNCFGYEYAGFPRKFEAVYGDEQLEVVWILTGKGEEDRVRQALTAAYGPAEHINNQWEIFAGFRVALRKDKPEILLLSDKMVPHYKAELLGRAE